MNSNIKETTKYSRVLVALVRKISFALGKILWRVEFHGKENIPIDSNAGLVIVSNHQSYLDPFLIGIPIKRKILFMAWDEAFNWFFIGRLIQMLGAFPVKLESVNKNTAIKKALSALKNGNALMVFPEANRELSDGKLLPFKTGSIRLALVSGVPLLPVSIKGANRVWSRDHKCPRPGKIEIFYHPLMNLPAPVNDESVSDIVFDVNEKLRKTISSVIT